MLNPHKDTVYATIKAAGHSIYTSSQTPAGLLVRLSGDYGAELAARVLRASGYTAQVLDHDTLLVGGVDELALLEGQIAALTERREELARQRRVEAVEAEMGGPF